MFPTDPTSTPSSPPPPPAPLTWDAAPPQGTLATPPAQAWAAPPIRPGASIPSNRPTQPRIRTVEGLLVGLAAAVVAGAVWWAAAAVTQRQFVYLAILAGFAVGQGVLIGARRGSPVLAVYAVIVTLASLACAEYFIQRTLAIQNAGADVALWQNLDFAREVVRSSVSNSPINGVFWLVSAAAAGAVTARRSARPLI